MEGFNFPRIKLEIELYLNSTKRRWWQFRKHKYTNEELAYGLTQLINSLRLKGEINGQ